MGYVNKPQLQVDNITLQSVAGTASVKDSGITQPKLAAGVCKTQRGTYAGTGASKDVAVGFRPQLVLVGVVGDATRIGYAFDGQDNQEVGLRGTTLVSSTSIDFTAAGFTLAAASAFNTAATTYYWVAYGGAT